jgi:hypothetical protein
MLSKNKIFLSYPVGHGYELLQDQNTGELSPLANRVQRLARGADSPRCASPTLRRHSQAQDQSLIRSTSSKSSVITSLE